jgi:uncharacterized protein involved in exopolysaccharide biosynthesis
MSIVTSGPGGRRPPPEPPEDEPAARDEVRARTRPAPPDRASGNGHPPDGLVREHPAPDGHDADHAAAEPDGLTVVVRPRQHARSRALRWPALILLALLLVGVGAKAGSTVAAGMPTLYAAHSDVVYPLVQEQPTGFLREDRNLSTQEVLIASREVTDPVAAQFKIPADQFDEHLTTEVVNDSEVIRLQYTDPSRAQARKVLAAIVDQYVKVSNNPSRTAVRQYLDAQLADVQALLATARTQADAVGNLGLSQAAQAQVDALVNREATLLGQIDQEQFAAIAGPAPRIAVPAYVEHDAVSPNRLLVTAGGALAGLVVALIVVAVLARRMTRH